MVHWVGGFSWISLAERCLIWRCRCAQLFVYSTGGEARPSKTVSIPGYVDSKHPGVLFNYWANMKPKNYQTPGPEVYLRTNAGGSKPKIVAFERWGKYSECLTSNGNWCGVSLPKYTNEDGCWKVGSLVLVGVRPR